MKVRTGKVEEVGNASLHCHSFEPSLSGESAQCGIGATMLPCRRSKDILEVRSSRSLGCGASTIDLYTFRLKKFSASCQLVPRNRSRVDELSKLVRGNESLPCPNLSECSGIPPFCGNKHIVIREDWSAASTPWDAPRHQRSRLNRKSRKLRRRQEPDHLRGLPKLRPGIREEASGSQFHSNGLNCPGALEAVSGAHEIHHLDAS
jgi:hypothetical protein